MAGQPQPAQPGVAITTVDSRYAEITLTGDVGTVMLRDLEERFDDPRLHSAEHWVLNMRSVARIDLACAYALLHAVTRHPGTASVCGARRAVLRTLRRAGLDKACVIEE
ncbi:STAS domain-containing protein [Streptomyces paradoxus]|uniref:STAS domain-containing protein n=1 Tax=Streptomyces paradoxus TaxID=66375 RepID=UPI0036FD15BB